MDSGCLPVAMPDDASSASADLRDGSHRDVVILGAGFSRAISQDFPLTDELGTLAVAEADDDGNGTIPHPPFANGSFETWLSRLAEDQPYLTAAANLGNRARFLRISQAIRAVLASRQAAALASDAPGWLYDLLSILHMRRATITTLNYDNLIECAVDTGLLYDHATLKWVTSTDILNGLPPAADHPAGLIPDHLARTFRLLKLHGSLSWYWSPDDTTGTTVQRWTTPGVFGAPVPDDEDRRRRALPGREPFIVPPSAAKSVYYRNLITRELWSQAYSALRRANRIVLAGYSLPVGDLTFSGMIGDAAPDRDTAIEIINPHPGPVLDRLAALGIRDRQITHVDDGMDCMDKFTRRYRDEQARDLATRLRTSASSPVDGPIIVSWGNTDGLHPSYVQPVATITGPDHTGDALLHLTGADVPITPDRARLSDLRTCLPQARRLVAVTTNGRQIELIDQWATPGPADRELRWISLIPAGKPGF
jgi:hypothetical protein